MSTRFLLPCSCGESIPVTRSQSGLDVTCPQCQRQQRVPKLAQLQTLPQLRDESNESSWGTAQLIVFIGLVVFLCGVALAAWKWYSLGPSPMAEMEKLYGPLPENFSPADTLMAWEQINKEGLDARFPVPSGAYRFEALYSNWLAHRNWIWIWLGVAAVGLLVALVGLFEVPRQARRGGGRRPRPAAS